MRSRPTRVLPFRKRSNKPSTTRFSSSSTILEKPSPPERRRTLGDKLQQLAVLRPAAIHALEMRVDLLLYRYDGDTQGTTETAGTGYP